MYRCCSLINDLPSFISFFSILLFTDDTKLSQQVSSPSDCAHLQWDINALQQWCFESGLSFNTTKCFVLHFCTSSLVHTDYVLHGSVLKSVSSVRDLGVTFSDDLSWSLHYQAISRSAYSQLSLLQRTFSASCPTSVKKLLYLTLVHSKLTYFGDPLLFVTLFSWNGFFEGPPNSLLIMVHFPTVIDCFH